MTAYQRGYLEGVQRALAAVKTLPTPANSDYRDRFIRRDSAEHAITDLTWAHPIPQEPKA